MVIFSMILSVLPVNYAYASTEEPLTIEKVDFTTTSIEKERTSDDEKLLENYQQIKTEAPLLSEDKTHIILPSCDEGYEVSLYGTSNPAVIDMEGNVIQPLEDMEVYLFYQIENTETNESLHMDDPIKVVVNGKYGDEYKNINRPEIIPGIREWKGNEGDFHFTGKIVIADESLQEAASYVSYYINEMTDIETAVVQKKAEAGDIYLEYNKSLSVGKEGYTIDIKDIMTVQATDYQGIVYAGATIAQMFMQSTNQTIPCGIMRDYPQYEVRSTMFDVARFYMPLDYVEEITKYAAFFKMNEIHLHINDCGGEQDAAFRVESKKFPALNTGLAEDEIYSQEDYINYQKRMKKLGVDIVTEIDTPAHATSFWYVDPSIMLDTVHVNIYDEEARNFVKSVYDEFLDPENPVFLGEAFNVGVDEYPPGNNEQVRAYMDEMIKYIDSKGIEARLWSGLNDVVSDQPYTGYAGETPVSNKGVFHFYNDAVADLTTMLEGEYRMINNMYQNLYIVPVVVNGTNDFLNLEKVYDTWEAGIVSFGEGEIMPGHPLLLGSETSIWNDAKAGCSEFDLFDRAKDQIMLMAEKNWYGRKGEGQSSEEFVNRVNKLANTAPGSNPARYIESTTEVIARYDFGNSMEDRSENGYDAKVHGLTIDEEMNALKLDGNGYISLPFNSVGYPYTVEFDMYISSDTPANALMFSGKDGELIYNVDGTGKIGFKRKGYTYLFDYEVPLNEMIHYTLVCKDERTYLSTEDSFQVEADYYQVSAYTKGSSSFVFPTEKIGSGIKGYIKSLVISKSENNSLAIENIALGKEVMISGPEGGYNEDGTYVYPQFDKDNVTDGNSNTRTSLEYKDDAWIEIDLGEVYLADTIQIQFTNRPISYELYVSEDGNKWELMDTRTELAGGSSGAELHTLSNGEKVRYIKYQQTKMWYHTDQDFYYSAGISEIEVYGLSFIMIREVLDKATNCLTSVPETEENKDIRAKLEESISICNDLMDNGSCEELINIIHTIQQLSDKLYNGNYDIPITDKTILKQLLDEEIDITGYDSNLVNIYLDALEKGKEVYYDITASQKKIELVVDMIQEAKENMMAVNLALNKPVTVSGVEGGYDENGNLIYPQFDPKHATDGDMNTRISLNYADDAWVQVDLGSVYVLDSIKTYFSQRPVGYKMMVSRDGINWKTVDEKNNLEGGSSGLDEVTFKEYTEARYVRYQQTAMWYSEASGAQYYSGNFYELEVYGSLVKYENVSNGKSVEISGPEGGFNDDGSFVYPQFDPKHVTDNDFNTRTSLEYKDDAWIKIDLEKEYYIDRIITSLTNQPISYEIYISQDGNEWILVDKKEGLTGGVAATYETVLSESLKARFVKFQQTEMWYHTDQDFYYSAGVSEIQILGREVPDTTQIEKLIADSENLIQDHYTVESWQIFNERLVEAKKLLQQYYLTETDIDNVYNLLQNAFNSLKYNSADYTAVDEAITKANGLNKDLYKDFSGVAEALANVVYDLDITHQAEVDTMAKAIEDAINALEYKGADYTALNSAILKATNLDKNLYKDFSAVEKALEAVIPDLDITHQAEVDTMAKAIEDAINTLEYKDADYSAVEKAKAKVPADLSIYTEESVKALNDALAGVEEGKNITEQEEVDAMAKAIENAINGLVKKDTGKPEDPSKPADPAIPVEPENPTTPSEPETPTEPEGPNTSDNYHVAVFAGLMILSAGVLAFVLLRRKREAK